MIDEMLHDEPVLAEPEGGAKYPGDLGLAVAYVLRDAYEPEAVRQGLAGGQDAVDIADLQVLLAKVREDERARLRTETALPKPGPVEVRDVLMYEAGQRDERIAIVAWLRSMRSMTWFPSELATQIEDGVHVGSPEKGEPT